MTMGQRVNDGRAEQPMFERVKREQRRYETASRVLAARVAQFYERDDDRNVSMEADIAVIAADALLAALEADRG